MAAGVTGGDKQGWLEAWTEFHPATGFSYRVIREGGTEYIRDRVLRKLLDNEQELIADGKPLHPPLESRNYVFADGGTAEGGLQRLLLKPARRADGIVEGQLLLTPDRIVQMQGRLVKSPSLWVRDVDVTWRYAQVGSHILPTDVSATARTRFYGRSYLTVSYAYASVDGRPADARARASR